MQPIKSVIRRHTQKSMTTPENADLKKTFVVDDARHAASSVADVFMMQLFIHMTMASNRLPDGSLVNEYEPQVSLGQGVYPNRKDHPLLDANGYFIVDPDMGLMNMQRLGKSLFMVSDFHRGTENRYLAASHLGAHRIHNYRMDMNSGDFERSKKDTIAFLSRIFMDCGLRMMPTYSEADVLNSDLFANKFAGSAESILQVGRWMHTQVPDTVIVQGTSRALFDPVNPRDVLWAELGEQPAGELGMRVAPSMKRMEPQPDPKDIIERNLNAAMENEVATVGDMLLDRSFRNTDTILKESQYARWPLWAGVCKEARDGQLGPVGEMLIAQTLKECLQAVSGQGLWRDSWWSDEEDMYLQIDDLAGGSTASDDG